MKLDGDTATKTVNLLVIDDEEQRLMSVMMMFYETDVNVIAESDSRRALEYINKNRNIDIILLDLMMPDLDGVEFLEGLQAIGGAYLLKCRLCSSATHSPTAILIVM